MDNIYHIMVMLNIDHIFRVELHVLTCVKSNMENR